MDIRKEEVYGYINKDIKYLEKELLHNPKNPQEAELQAGGL